MGHWGNKADLTQLSTPSTTTGKTGRKKDVTPTHRRKLFYGELDWL
jgi:hypothetical protein